ncbi:hypothetical protein V8B97DRAFT_1872891, partial [Scleroderma yunnanense]
CVSCKEKMVQDDNIMEAPFWLLNSSTTCHFAGNKGDFTQYKELTYKRNTTIVNSKVPIVGVSTVLLW